jgi:hypothetical protein
MNRDESVVEIRLQTVERNARIDIRVEVKVLIRLPPISMLMHVWVCGYDNVHNEQSNL